MRYKTLAELKKMDKTLKTTPLYDEVPTQSTHLTSPNPCVRAFGPHPGEPYEYVGHDGEKHTSAHHHMCQSCNHLEMHPDEVYELGAGGRPKRTEMNVCAFRGEAGMPGIHHKTSWPACARWEKREDEK